MSFRVAQKQGNVQTSPPQYPDTKAGFMQRFSALNENYSRPGFPWVDLPGNITDAERRELGEHYGRLPAQDKAEVLGAMLEDNHPYTLEGLLWQDQTGVRLGAEAFTRRAETLLNGGVSPNDTMGKNLTTLFTRVLSTEERQDVFHRTRNLNAFSSIRKEWADAVPLDFNQFKAEVARRLEGDTFDNPSVPYGGTEVIQPLHETRKQELSQEFERLVQRLPASSQDAARSEYWNQMKSDFMAETAVDEGRMGDLRRIAAMNRAERALRNTATSGNRRTDGASGWDDATTRPATSGQPSSSPADSRAVYGRVSSAFAAAQGTKTQNGKLDESEVLAFLKALRNDARNGITGSDGNFVVPNDVHEEMLAWAKANPDKLTDGARTALTVDAARAQPKGAAVDVTLRSGGTANTVKYRIVYKNVDGHQG